MKTKPIDYCTHLKEECLIVGYLFSHLSDFNV